MRIIVSFGLPPDFELESVPVKKRKEVWFSNFIMIRKFENHTSFLFLKIKATEPPAIKQIIRVKDANRTLCVKLSKGVSLPSVPHPLQLNLLPLI